MSRIDCREIAVKEQELMRLEITRLNTKPKLVTILIGSSSASEVYVKNKHKVCEYVGILTETKKLDENITEIELIEIITKLNKDSSVHGILVQLPLPSHIDPNNVAMSIDPNKDVDGFHPLNLGRLFRGESGRYPKPCTPKGVMKMFEHLGYELEGKEVMIIGRSNILGKPMAQMIMQAGATVLQIHSKSPLWLRDYFNTFCPDIVVSCVGEYNLFEYSDLHTPTLLALVDCAILRGGDGKLRGDFKKEDYHYLEEDGIDYTPVPGGIGVLTTTMLARNVLECYNILNK